MNCEEFEILGLHSQRDSSVGDDGRERVLQHARVCGRCAALGASWAAAQAELAALAESSRSLHVHARVETRVLQQFRLKHQPRQERRFLQFATWALAAAFISFQNRAVRSASGICLLAGAMAFARSK